MMYEVHVITYVPVTCGESREVSREREEQGGVGIYVFKIQSYAIH